MQAVIDADAGLSALRHARADLLVGLRDLEAPGEAALAARAAAVRDLLAAMRAAGADLPADLVDDVRALLGDEAAA